MNINEYAKAIETKVAEIAGEEMAVTLNEKILNNGGVEYQITVGKKDSRIRPSINISHYVEEFGEDLDRIAHEILDTAMEHQNVEGFNPEDVLNKEYLLDKAVVQLVNKERNQEALTTRGAVTFDFLNLTAVIRIKALVGNTTGTFIATKQMCENADLDVAELIEAAKENTGKNVCWIGLKQVMEDAGKDTSGMPDVMTIGTNGERSFGASIMMFSEKFRELSESLYSDLWIIPSSVHEIIAVPMNEIPYEALAPMVAEVNRSCVDPVEVLTDTVYKYEHETGKVSVAA